MLAMKSLKRPVDVLRRSDSCSSRQIPENRGEEAPVKKVQEPVKSSSLLTFSSTWYPLLIILPTILVLGLEMASGKAVPHHVTLSAGDVVAPPAHPPQVMKAPGPTSDPAREYHN